MPDSKITALTALTSADPANDMFPIVDVSDTSMAASGTTKRISINNLLAASGTATLASATITGAATVGTTLGVTGVSTFAAGTALLPALTTTGDTNTGIYYPAADTFAVTTGGTERYRVDSTGNVGIGVTPSAWNSAVPALQVKGVIGVYGAGSSEFGSVQNCFYNASAAWIYGTTAAAGRYAISSGSHQWFTAPSGTAGNPITFTQAMTLDASGNLLVGTTSPLSSVSGSSQIALGGAGLQTTSQAISAATATTICRSGSGGMAVVGGYNGTGQYSAIIIFSYGAGGGVTVVSSQNNTGSTITYALSGVNVQITSSLALTNLTTTCIRTA